MPQNFVACDRDQALLLPPISPGLRLEVDERRPASQSAPRSQSEP